MRFLFIDVETNDHPSKRFELRIVTITWIIAQSNSFVEKMENHIVKPEGFRIAPGATRVHGVTEDQARKYGRPVSDVLGRLVHDLQSFTDLTIVGHKVDFDIKVVGAELSRNGFRFDIFAFPFICTMQSSKSVCKIPRAGGNGYKYPTLQELYLHLFGRCFSDAHTSKADAEATARCFFELMRRGALPNLKTQVPRGEPGDSKVRQDANASMGNSSAAGTPMQTSHVQDRIVVTNDYRKEEKGYRQHIKEIIGEEVKEGGLLANSVEKEPTGRVPTRAASHTVKQVVAGNPTMPDSAPHAKKTFAPIGTPDGRGAALKSGVSTPTNGSAPGTAAGGKKSQPGNSSFQNDATKYERGGRTAHSSAGGRSGMIPMDILVIGVLMIFMMIVVIGKMFSTGRTSGDKGSAAHKDQTAQSNAPGISTRFQASSPSPGSHPAATTGGVPAGAHKRPKEVAPPVGRQHILQQEQIFYCLSEEIRIDAMRKRIDLTSKGEVDWFNSRVADFRSRCGRYRYYDRVMDAARADAELHRDGLNAVGAQRVVDWRQEQKLRGRP